LSDPGAELERDLSFLAASSGVTGAYTFSSTGGLCQTSYALWR
jgi:hypothetical protein